jgi:hypothetical protein
MIFRLCLRTRLLLAVGAIGGGVLASPPVLIMSASPALAQASTSLEFQRVLETYGRWMPHRRWGEVWVPDRVPPEWRPYLLGRWTYTDEWGWYWISDEPFGWVTYHYGRWIFDEELGWAWVPGEEWGPAWVSWRRSGEVVGWAALPPDEVVEEVIYERPDPSYWSFVGMASLTAPRLRQVILPAPRAPELLRETIIVNRTLVSRERGSRIGVNPGIPPAFVAAASKRPVRAVEIRPPVLAGTAGIKGAVVYRPDQLRAAAPKSGAAPGPAARAPLAPRPIIRESKTSYRPGAAIPAPEALERGQPGRLGEAPPRAARPDAGGVGPRPGLKPGDPAATRPGIPPAAGQQGVSGPAPSKPGEVAPPRSRPGAITPGGEAPAARSRPGAIPAEGARPGQAKPTEAPPAATAAPPRVRPVAPSPSAAPKVQPGAPAAQRPIGPATGEPVRPRPPQPPPVAAPKMAPAPPPPAPVQPRMAPSPVSPPPGLSAPGPGAGAPARPAGPAPQRPGAAPAKPGEKKEAPR